MLNQKMLWKSTTGFQENSNLKHYENWLKKHKNLQFEDYNEFWKWSVDNIEDFWESLWEYFEIKSHTDYKQVLSGHKMPESIWFEGAKLNYAEHIFRQKNTENPALIFQNENKRLNLSWTDLEIQVIAVQQFLLEKGIQKGDCVAAYLPNIPEAIVCFLAVNSIGAVWSCCSPDFGVETVIERFSQIQPKLFITCDGYQYNGKPHNRLAQVDKIRSAIPTIESTLFVPYLNKNAILNQSIHWQTVLNHSNQTSILEFTAVEFNHPIWVLYSSGTTGRPKAITHSHGGVLLEHLKYMAFHNDAKKGENFFWFSTTGWMMWNFLQASMLIGAIPVLFDGSPGLNNMNVLWEMAEELPIHHFGTSAPYLTACMKKDLAIKDTFDLSNLRSIGSTGAPLPPEVFEWIYENIKSDLWLCSMSGGTDVCTAFVGGNPYLPVYKGFIQSRALGCALYAYTESGVQITESLGEMVIEKPMPSMPIYFWNDENKKRYKSSYFETFEGKWRHGDWIKIEENGSLIIQGRSDATLNRNGIRIGTAEIYNVLDKIKTIKDSLILNLEQKDGDDIMPLFVVMNEIELTTAIESEIKQQLRIQCSPRHVPTNIIAVPDIPYTLSGKKMEVPIKKAFLKMDIQKSMNRDAIRNPEAMDYFIQLSETLFQT